MIESVSIQGIKGSFHHIVAKEWFGNGINIKECLSFDKTVESLVNGETQAAILAIENSIAGSILPNYALIDTNRLHIIGEHYLDIQHNLMALPGQTIADITEVYSHAMALLQCKEFFKKHTHIKLIEDKDTAEVAHRINHHKLEKIGAVASTLAAELFGLEILEKSIQTIKHNETRFAIVQTKNHFIPQNEINKASLKFELSHEKGSLAEVLQIMSDANLNLTKIQSLPKISEPWKYAFFADAVFNSYSDYDRAKRQIESLAFDFKVLGEYKNAKHG